MPLLDQPEAFTGLDTLVESTDFEYGQCRKRLRAKPVCAAAIVGTANKKYMACRCDVAGYVR